MAQDNYQLITNKIVDLFEKVGAGDFQQPWATAGGPPRNGHTNNNYHGVNVLMLWGEALANGYSTNEWLTYRQAQKEGGQVRKGESGSKICFFKIVERDVEDDAGNEETKSFPVLRVWTVFNRDQIDGLEPLVVPEHQLTEEQRIEQAEAFVKNTGATVEEGSPHAAYSPSNDRITMPDFGHFTSPERYYTTLLHELGHWTGHPTRLERDMSGRFGDKEYAAEELVAELTSAFLSAELGLQADLKDPARYLKSWIRLLTDDKYAIFTASRKAQDAAEFLKDLQPAEDAQDAA
jgi:antirestriction protein ArdC